MRRLIWLLLQPAGNVVIDGIVASSYNTMLGSEANMHAVTAAGRLLYRIAPSLFRNVHAKRVAEPVSLAIGSVASKVSRTPCCYMRCILQTSVQPLRRLQHALTVQQT